MKALSCAICGTPAEGGHHVGDSTVIIWPQCGGYCLADTALTMLKNGALKTPERSWFKKLVRSRRGDSDQYPLITSYDLGG